MTTFLSTFQGKKLMAARLNYRKFEFLGKKSQNSTLHQIADIHTCAVRYRKFECALLFFHGGCRIWWSYCGQNFEEKN